MKTNEDNRYIILGEVLMIERKTRGISQKKFAELLGVSQSEISKIELGARRLDVIELFNICKALGISMTDFIYRMENRLMTKGFLSPRMKKLFLRWKNIYYECYNIPKN